MDITTTSPKYSFRLQQSAKGFWYVERLEVNSEVYSETLEEMKKFSVDAMKLLDELNKEMKGS